MTIPDPKAIAAGLSEAQKAYLTVRSDWQQPYFGASFRWMTFPPANVHRVLIRLGLVDRNGTILDFGLAVKEALTDG